MFEDIFSGGKEDLLCTVPLGVTVDSHRLDTITQIEKEKNSQYGVRLSFGISNGKFQISNQYCPNVGIKFRRNILKTMQLSAKRRFIDLNLELIQTHTSVALRKEPKNEFRQNDLRSTDGLCFLLRISPLRTALSRQLQNQELFLLGAVSHHGVCPTDLSRESQRYRSVSASPTRQALSHGHSQSDFSQYPGPRQSGPRLENLRRLCTCAHPIGARPLPQRTFRRRAQSNRLRSRCYHYRSVPVAVSLGSVPPPQICRQTAHLAGSSRLHSHRGDCDRRTDSRSQHPRPTLLGSRRHLPDGSRLSRFSKTLPTPPVGSLLRDSGQKTIRLSAPFLSTGRQDHRPSIGSDRLAQQSHSQTRLSRAPSASAVLRSYEPKAPGVSDQQFSPAPSHYCQALSVSLAGGAVLSLDQATSAYQSLLRHLQKRGHNPNLDCHLRLRLGRYRQKTSQPRAKSPFDSTDFERLAFRENPDSTSSFST